MYLLTLKEIQFQLIFVIPGLGRRQSRNPGFRIGKNGRDPRITIPTWLMMFYNTLDTVGMADLIIRG